MSNNNGNHQATDSESLPMPQIEGLNELFHKHVGGATDEKYFPAGSTVVVAGPPGAGKTTFALGLVRSMLRDEKNRPDKNSTDAFHIAYYISTEVNRERLQRMFLSRGWFANEGDHRDNLFKSDAGSGNAGLHVINPPLEIERPVKTSEELVNYIVRQIAIQTPPEPGQKVFIIVDSVTALFKDTPTTGEGRRQAHELIFRLRQQFTEPNRLGMILLLSEQGISDLNDPGMETYVADFVFKLDLRSLNMGTRLRTLEVTKSQGKNIMMGMHTWVIVTNQSVDKVIAGKSLQANIKSNMKRQEGRSPAPKPDLDPAKDWPWGTFIVCHRPYTSYLPEKSQINHARFEHSGIIGLDQMLKFDPAFWFISNPDEAKAQSAKRVGAVRTGSVTMLVGEAGTGKTSLCFHVLKQHLKTHAKDGKCLLIGFENDLQTGFASFVKDLNKSQRSNVETIFRSRSALHFNLLLSEIRAWLQNNKVAPKRVAIDGISNLAATHSKQEFSQMLDALISLFSEYPQKDKPGTVVERATLFVTYESAQSERFFESEAFRLPAANIVILNHKEIADNRRTAVSVIKSCHEDFDTQVRELVLRHDNPEDTRIKSGFDAYSGLLSGKISPAVVELQLFHENEREKAFNLGAKRHLQKLLPYHFEIRDFSRFEIAATLDGIETHIRVPGGDVHIESMDEWWLSQKMKELRAMRKASGKKVEPLGLVDHAPFVRAKPLSAIKPGDFWCFEIEKARADSDRGPYALPAYLDFGMLCVGRGLLQDAAIQSAPDVRWGHTDDLPWKEKASSSPKWYSDALEKYLLPWCTIGTGDNTLKPPSSSGSKCLVDVMSRLLKPRVVKGKLIEVPYRYGFAWDSRTPETAACMLYEFAWAFGGTSGLYDIKSHPENQTAIQRAFYFLGYLVYHGLTPANPTLTTTTQSAFSRHYYSTLTDVNNRLKDESKKLVSLGFMPPGPIEWAPQSFTKQDNKERDERLTERQRLVDKTKDDPNASPNPNDIRELKRWQKFRKQLEESGSWADVLTPNPSARNAVGTNKGVRTGYGCCGAWLVGVKNPTASPGIAQVVMEELASLSFAKKRARMGAGLPARQDFYQLYGNHPVTGIEHLSWREMLCYLGSRDHRRDRLFTEGEVSDFNPSKAHATIHAKSANLMELASDLKASGSTDWQTQIQHEAATATATLIKNAFDNT